MNRIHSPPLCIGFFFGLAFSIYYRTLPAEFYFDDGFLTSHPLITDLKNFPHFFQGGETLSPMRGISTLSFALNYQLTGWSPWAFRFFNICLHCINACLVWKLALLALNRVRMLKGKTCSEPKSNGMNADNWIAFFTASWFIAHPVLTSGVAYIFQRNGLLSAFFYLSAFLFLFKAFPLAGRVRLAWLYGSALAYLLSTWSKEIGITFIAVVFLFEWLLQPHEGRSERLKHYLPFACACAFSLFMAYWQMVKTPILARTMYGDWSVWQNAITQWNVVVEYLKLILWPNPEQLSIDHRYPVSLSLWDDGAWISGLILVSILGIAFILSKNHRLIAFSIFWFFICLIPESTLVPISEVMVEYRLYLPGLGFSFAGVLILRRTLQSLQGEKWFPLTGAIILGILALFSFQRNHVLADKLLVWEDAASKSPINIRAHTAYATTLLDRGRREEAMAAFKKAVVLNEQRPPFQQRYPNPHNEWGLFVLEKGNVQGAKKQFLTALGINPRYEPAKINLARALEAMGEENYLKEYESVFKQVAHFPDGHYNVGNYFLKKKEYSSAIKKFQTAIDQKPDFFEAYSNMGVAYGYTGERAKAIKMFNNALRLKPGYTHAEANLKALGYPFN